VIGCNGKVMQIALDETEEEFKDDGKNKQHSRWAAAEVKHAL